MKRIIGTALVVALALTLCLGTAVLADDPQEVNTSWEFDGEGSIQIDTYKIGGANGEDHLYVESSGSGSEGWQSISVAPHSDPWCGTDFNVDRSVGIADGSVSTLTVRNNEYVSWGATTEHRSFLNVDSTGNLEQHFSNTYHFSHMNTDIEADGVFEMEVVTEGSVGGDWLFNIGAGGVDSNSTGELLFHTTDTSEFNDGRLLYGGFLVETESGIAGFDTEWGILADFNGYAETLGITQDFDVNVSGSGYYGESVSASRSIIEGFISGMK